MLTFGVHNRVTNSSSSPRNVLVLAPKVQPSRKPCILGKPEWLVTLAESQTNQEANPVLQRFPCITVAIPVAQPHCVGIMTSSSTSTTRRLRGSCDHLGVRCLVNGGSGLGMQALDAKTPAATSVTTTELHILEIG